MKIGVFTPQSSIYPSLGMQFLNGLRLGLKGLDVEIEMEGIGLGSQSKLNVDANQKLLMKEPAIVTGILGHIGMDELFNFFEGNNKLLLYSDLGGTIPFQRTHGKNIFCNSLGLWESMMLGAKRQIEKGTDKVANALSFYEAGYGVASSYVSTLLENGGGVRLNFITPDHATAESEVGRFKSMTTGAGHDSLLLSYSGKDAGMLREMLELGMLENENNVFGSISCFMDDEVSKAPHLYQGIRCFGSWDQTLENDVNQKFAADFDDRYEVAPSFYAMLGYENGLLIKKAVEAVGEEQLKTKNLRAALEAVAIDGPRGNLSFNDFHRTSFDHYEFEIGSGDGQHFKSVTAKMPHDSELVSNVLTSDSDQKVGGWLNAYLCE